MADFAKYVNLLGGGAFGIAAFTIGLNDLFKTNAEIPSAPDSIVLTVLTLAAFSLIVTSIVGTIGLIQKGEDVVSKELLKQTMGFHHRLSGRLVMITGLYAGLTLGGKASKCGDDEDEACDALFSGEWTLGEGVFLGSLIYKCLDAGLDFLVTLYSGGEDYTPMTDSSVGEKMARDYAGLGALGIGFILFMVNHGFDEVFDKYTTSDGTSGVPTFLNTSLAVEEGNVDKPLLLASMIISILVLVTIVLGVGLMIKDNYLLDAVGTLSSALTHVVSGLLSIHVGKYLHVAAYNTADGDFLPANFFYFGAAILAASAAIHFDAKDVIEEDEDKTQKAGTVRTAAAFALISGVMSLWSAQTLYSNVNYIGDVKATKADGSIVDVQGPIVSKARELGMYALILIVFLTFQAFSVKIFETIVKTSGSFVGLFKGVKTNTEDRFSTLRTEMAIVFALASAVLWGSKVVQGGSPALGDGTLAPLWILWVVSAAGRGLAWLNVLAEDEVVSLGQLVKNGKSKRIFSDEKDNTKVTIPCLGAVISLFLSLVAFIVFIFHDSNKATYKLFGDDDYTRFFQGLTFILLIAHVLLTILGMIPGIGGLAGGHFHANNIPILRFGVSSIVIWSMAMAAGQSVLSTANQAYAFPSLALYLTYDILSKGRF